MPFLQLQWDPEVMKSVGVNEVTSVLNAECDPI